MQPVSITDPATGSAARIAPHLGFNCYNFAAQVAGRIIHVLYGDPDFSEGHLPPTKHGIPILFPFPNRIRQGRYTWDGRDYYLPPELTPYDPPGINAIHGFCLDRPWRVTNRGESFVEGQFQLSKDAPERRDLWPADFILQVRYEISGASLVMKIRVSNCDDKPLPWGFGTHPYFRVPLARESATANCTVSAAAPQIWELVDCLPTGTLKPAPPEKDLRKAPYYDELKLDDVYTRLNPPRQGFQSVVIDEKAGLQVVQRSDPIFRELVAFTPPHREAICLEPYTCVTDAINLQPQGVDAGWRTLAPGADIKMWIEIRAEPVVA